MMFRRSKFLIAVLLVLVLWGITAVSTFACGGLFCRNSPVDQNAERIIFTQNRDGTVTALVQIQYTGFDEDFSWILPLPEAIPAEAVAVPETATAAFNELDLATRPVFIPPPLPDCALPRFSRQTVVESVVQEVEVTRASVQVFSSGEVGPFGFVVIGSEDPEALVTWLRENGYRVEPEMEPLIDVYVEEQFVFMAMRLLPERGVQDIAPIQITYPAERPMIPLRLTAVAANPDMAVITWFFADTQAVPDNFAHMEIADHELTFFVGGGNNYRQLMGTRADEYNGRAFITEFASPTDGLRFADPLLNELAQKHAYLTRLNTVISPEEMRVDPVFDYNPQLLNVSNIHDLSDSTGLYDCERDAGKRVEVRGKVYESGERNIISTLLGGAEISDGEVEENDGDNGRFGGGVLFGVGAMVILAIGFVLGRRS